MACVGGKAWYFYSLRDRKYATGQRTNRATMTGYWKATGKDRQVRRRGAMVGMRKTLVFYHGRAPKGKKTDWVMHEFRMESSDLPSFPPLHVRSYSLLSYSFSRVIHKSRGGATTSEPATETSCHDNNPNASSLPPLMEPFISFDPARLESNTQVPCFSDLPPSSVPLQDVAAPPTSTGGFPDSGAYDSNDDKVIKNVLNHFLPPSLPQGSLESFFADNGLSQMWNTF
ncbi:hypothetical protein BHE74_00034748 [Ensete ventricosum]|nr:hypothetical protein GW17_00023016 [Ensete ventricosum]RWW58412.1 hypothetical protein BHE74_00034748 [Ensete ventricosum]